MSQIRVISNRFPEIAAALPGNAGQAVQEAAGQIADTARGLAPTRTGALRASIGAAATGTSSAEVTASARYAIYVEFGTAIRGAAQPFMTPAGEQGRPLLEAAMRQRLIPGA